MLFYQINSNPLNLDCEAMQLLLQKGKETFFKNQSYFNAILTWMSTEKDSSVRKYKTKTRPNDPKSIHQATLLQTRDTFLKAQQKSI